MREIKFRGFTKELVKNEWVYGNLIKRDNGECIIIDDDFRIWDISHDGFQVEPETIGQFTGLYDKNGKEVFEGDIVKDDYKRIMKIGEWRYKPCFIAVSETNFRHADFFEWLIGDTNVLECEIIGNIHENPELLEQ